MKALCTYLAIAAVAINVAGNLASNSAKGLQEASDRRSAQLCKVNQSYCN